MSFRKGKTRWDVQGEMHFNGTVKAKSEIRTEDLEALTRRRDRSVEVVMDAGLIRSRENRRGSVRLWLGLHERSRRMTIVASCDLRNGRGTRWRRRHRRRSVYAHALAHAAHDRIHNRVDRLIVESTRR